MENRQLIEPKDVMAVQFECGKCGVRITYPLTGDRKPETLIRCKVCNEDWIALNSQDHDALRLFVDGIAKIVPALRGRQFKLMLEIPGQQLIG